VSRGTSDESGAGELATIPRLRDPVHPMRCSGKNWVAAVRMDTV
jgi:hypothetical protein